MASNYSAASIDELSIDDIAKLEIADLARMQAELSAMWKSHRDRSAKLIDALELRFAARAQHILLQEKSDTGTVNFPETGFEVKRVTGKDIKYDQALMLSIYNRIVAAGDNPGTYMKATYEINEAAYKDWPEPLQKAFEEARTVKPTRAKYTFTKKS